MKKSIISLVRDLAGGMIFVGIFTLLTGMAPIVNPENHFFITWGPTESAWFITGLGILLVLVGFILLYLTAGKKKIQRRVRGWEKDPWEEN